MTKRYTLNVSKDVYTLLKKMSLAELKETDKPPSIDELLRKLLKVDKPKKESP